MTQLTELIEELDDLVSQLDPLVKEDTFYLCGKQVSVEYERSQRDENNSRLLRLKIKTANKQLLMLLAQARLCYLRITDEVIASGRFDSHGQAVIVVSATNFELGYKLKIEC